MISEISVLRVIRSFDLVFLLPISLVTENMKRAQRRNAVLEQKLYFRKGLARCTDCYGKPFPLANKEEIIEMTVNEIINGKASDIIFSCVRIQRIIMLAILGKDDEFPGLVPLIHQYLDSADVDVDTRCTITQYLTFLQVLFLLGFIVKFRSPPILK